MSLHGLLYQIGLKMSFEDYLKKKYGPRYMLAALTDDEFAQLNPIDLELIIKALKQGEEDAELCRKYDIPCSFSNLRFK